MVGVETANDNNDFSHGGRSGRSLMKIPSHYEQRFLSFACLICSSSVLCGDDFHMMLSDAFYPNNYNVLCSRCFEPNLQSIRRTVLVD